MNNLDGFLKKFKLALGARNAETEIVIKELLDCAGIKAAKEAIQIRKNIVYVEGSPAMRSQIFQKKNQILEALRKHEELKNISDIR